VLHRVILNKAGQSLVHIAAALPSATASYTIEDLTKSEDDPARVLGSGSVGRALLSLTTDADAGAGQADAARVPVLSTTGADIGDAAVIVAADGSFERLQIEAIAAGVYVAAERPLIGAYASGSTVAGCSYTVPAPAALTGDEELADDHRVLRIVWEYTLEATGELVRVQEQIRVVRQVDSDIDTDGLRELCLEMYPDLRDRLPQGNPRQLDRWVNVAARLVRGHMRRKGARPELLLMGDALTDAIVFRALEIAASNQCVPAARDPEEFREEMGTRYAEIFHGLMTGKAGQETASITPTTDVSPNPTAVGVRSPIRSW
jgi:hypothetical protein